MVAEPVADRCAKYSIMLRYIAPRMARAVVVIDPIFGRFVDLIDGVEVVYFRHGNFFLDWSYRPSSASATAWRGFMPDLA